VWLARLELGPLDLADDVVGRREHARRIVEAPEVEAQSGERDDLGHELVLRRPELAINLGVERDGAGAQHLDAVAADARQRAGRAARRRAGAQHVQRPLSAASTASAVVAGASPASWRSSP